MTDSTRRALRTVYHGVLAACVVLPIFATALAGFPIAAQLTLALAVLGAVSKAVNALEDAGLLPPWLKGDSV